MTDQYVWCVIAFGYMTACVLGVMLWAQRDELKAAAAELEKLRYAGAGDRVSLTVGPIGGAYATIHVQPPPLPVRALAADNCDDSRSANPADVDVFELTSEIERLTAELELTRTERDEAVDERDEAEKEIDEELSAYEALEAERDVLAREARQANADFCDLDRVATAALDIAEAKQRLTVAALEEACDQIELRKLERDEARDERDLALADLQIEEARVETVISNYVKLAAS